MFTKILQPHTAILFAFFSSNTNFAVYYTMKTMSFVGIHQKCKVQLIFTSLKALNFEKQLQQVKKQNWQF